jgi:ureidoglycolate dehydrogenase (NAD+)
MPPWGGVEMLLSTNPISFAIPALEEPPIILDMATSVVTFNKIRQLREEKKPAPPGVGANKEGAETTDPNEIAMLLPVGGYKGYGLSMVVEILCGLFTGMPYGPHIPKMFEAPMSQKRFLGQFVIAMKIDCFQNKEVFKERLSAMMKELRNEPALDRNIPVQVAGDPEKKNYEERIKKGIPLKPSEYEAFQKMSKEYSIEL